MLKKIHPIVWIFSVAMVISGLIWWCFASGVKTPIQTSEPLVQEHLIMGEAELPQAVMVDYIKTRNGAAKLNCSVEELVSYYYEEAGSEGIKADIAICQAIKETGCFGYGGDVIPEQNNYCGLGTTGGGVKGHFFAAPREGVRAHIQHLLAYAAERKPHQAIIDPRYELLKEKRPELFGKVKTWEGLSGNWAVPGKSYGEEIIMMWNEIKQNHKNK